MDNTTTEERERDRAKKVKDLGTRGKEPKKEVEELFHRLQLEAKFNSKLTASDVLQITAHSLQSHGSCTEEELAHMFLQKLMMMNYRASSITVTKTREHHNETQQKPKQSFANYVDVFSEIFEEPSLSDERKSNTDPIHPMDVQMAVFHCADSFLKQLMVTKLSQCQYALPLLVPDPYTQQIEFPLWAFREVNQSWKIKNNNNETISQNQPVWKAETPMVFFFRFGSMSSSKSQLINSLINERHNTFFHRNCPGSSRTRVLMDGVVEIAWFCPSRNDDDKFTDRVAFCNLHSDAGEHEKQLDIMAKMASVNVVVLPQLSRNDKRMTKIQSLYMDPKPLICLLPQTDLALTEMGNGKYKIGLKDRGQADVSEDLRKAITNCLSESTSTFRLEDVSKHSDIRVDEDDDDDCRKGKVAAQQMMRLLKTNNLTKIKESFLPRQGKLWHQWCKMNKELNRPQGDDPEMEISKTKVEMMKIREQQHKAPISEFINLFMKQMNSHVTNNLMFFLKWLRILLDEYTSANLSGLYHEYDKTWTEVSKRSRSSDKSPELLIKQTELVELSKKLQDATFGVEHIMREIGQIYESCSSVKNKKDPQFDFSSLPSLAAEMMISGFPLELMDGDAAHIPVIWITGVLDQLIQKLGDQRVFVLSVLGLQSSGKSTMLNAMFGLQFAVSAGRCTRGAFMQLLRVSDEMREQMNFDYILVVDTEGLRALEPSGESTRHHDNELATFVIGLGNMTLINIFGENPSEMQDILQIVVQAFMRMKKVRLNPSCLFVHQNVSDVTAREKNMEGRRRLQQTLDKMTKLAAESEVCEAERFSDVIKFDVQKDVVYFAQLWEGTPPMAPPNPSYCENIQDLKKTILSHVSNSNGMMLTDIKSHIKNLWEALLKEGFVFSFKNALEIAAYRKLETEYSKWTWSLRRAMLEIENKLHNKIENGAIDVVEETDLQRELNVKSTEVKKSMSEFFEKDTNASILIQWKKSFEVKISNLHESTVKETKRKLNEVLQQRILKKKIDSQRTQNEKTLLEKAKNLALTLEDKANDEKILQNEFDYFWGTWLNEIIKDTPQVQDIDILRDLKDLLRDISESSSVLDWTESTQCDVLELSSYSDYVQIKKNKITQQITNVFTGTRSEYSKEDDSQIRNLLADTAFGAYTMILSYNIAKMGYNKSYIQELIDFIKAKLIDHEQRQQKYMFKKHFFSDLVLSICKREKKLFTEQHKIFKEANDPVLYISRKREEYYRIFQKYCQGATSATIIGEIICNKLKEPIQQSVYKKTARDLADEMKTKCESLNGNRSNLEKHILKTLAEKEDFEAYKTYIHNPKEHFKSFIRDEVSRYINDNFNISVLPKMKDDLRQKENQIIEAVQRASEGVEEKSGDADRWLKIFMQNLSDVLIFSEKDLRGVSHDVDVKHLSEVIIEQLPSIISHMCKEFSTESFLQKLEYKDRPDEILIEHFCTCCWVQCPFCKAICTNTAEDHDPQPHSVPFHRPDGLNGCHFRGTQYLCADFCTTLVASTKRFHPTHESKKSTSYKNYQTAGGVYAEWSITPDFNELPYWKWFVCRFQKKLENHYNKKFQDRGKIPDEWRNHTKQDAIESLDRYF